MLRESEEESSGIPWGHFTKVLFSLSGIGPWGSQLCGGVPTRTPARQQLPLPGRSTREKGGAGKHGQSCRLRRSPRRFPRRLLGLRWISRRELGLVAMCEPGGYLYPPSPASTGLWKGTRRLEPTQPGKVSPQDRASSGVRVAEEPRDLPSLHCRWGN